jgi:hypothetical protein
MRKVNVEWLPARLDDPGRKLRTLPMGSLVPTCSARGDRRQSAVITGNTNTVAAISDRS